MSTINLAITNHSAKNITLVLGLELVWPRNHGRDGKQIMHTSRLLAKDPFHLPRASIYCLDVLDRLIERSAMEKNV